MAEITRRQPARSALELIGNTPMVELTRFNTGPCRLFAKLENQNPGGSIKDRIGLAMIEAAEREGLIKPGDTIIEATAGNTGLGLALAGVLKGYHVLLVVPDKMAREKIQHLRALGTEVRITRSDVGKGHPEYYQDMAERIAHETGAYYVNQFANPANPKAHEEINRSRNLGTDGSRPAGDCPRRRFGRHADWHRALPAQGRAGCANRVAGRQGSILAPYVRTGEMVQAGSWAAEGIGEDFIPANADMSLVSRAYSISDREAVEAARALLAKEGILAGSSSGTLLAAALKYCPEQTEPQRVVTLSPTAATNIPPRFIMTYGCRSRVSPTASCMAICAI